MVLTLLPELIKIFFHKWQSTGFIKLVQDLLIFWALISVFLTRNSSSVTGFNALALFSKLSKVFYYGHQKPTFIFSEPNWISNTKNLFQNSLRGTIHISFMNKKVPKTVSSLLRYLYSSRLSCWRSHHSWTARNMAAYIKSIWKK